MCQRFCDGKLTDTRVTPGLRGRRTSSIRIGEAPFVRWLIRSCGAVMTAAGILASCSPWPEPPPRPENVPPDAVRVYGPKTWWWFKCWYDGKTDRCQIFNERGAVLNNDVYRPYDGGPVVQEEDLRIDVQRSGPPIVWLENGRILLPDSDFQAQKAFVDTFRGQQSVR